ncbi:MAG TPA: ImmA/IrrE family metallo-endopeptidase [Solirubrobacterales bacterium]|nr:ImmA/IrrE family metallo-endopeptidase [Solirubrobacterales bacterium]
MSANSVDRRRQLSLLDQERLIQPRRSDADCVAAIAERLIAELDEHPPISLEVVASYRDITEIEVVALPQSGSLSPAGKHMVMRLSASDSPRRRRFTGFHEVGHTFQGGYREQTLFRCNPVAAGRPSMDPEALADVAAAELLLPRREFKPMTLAAPFAISTVIGLADHFDASVHSTAYRFSTFWPEPTMVVALEPGKRRGDQHDPTVDPRLRVVSAWGSGSWSAGYVPTNKSATDGGALNRALAGEDVLVTAGLEELGLRASPGRVQVSAKKFTYRRGPDMRGRVLAIFRQVGG